LPTPYSRANPGPQFAALQALYRRMHAEGAKEQGLAAEKTFPGGSLLRHIKAVRRMVVATQARRVLDYGSGKGLQYRPQKIVVDGQHVADGVAEYWDVDEVRCYDPGYPPHAQLPEGTYDGVVCTDVLEHCSEEDLPWIVGELFAYAGRFVFANVACFPAKKTLPDGRNAHVTVQPPEWWRELFERAAASAPRVSWEISAVRVADGKVVDDVYRGGPPLDAMAEPAAPAGESPAVAVDFDGRTLRFRTPNAMTRWRAATLFTKEPVTIDWLRGIPEDAVVVDAGANVGMYTVAAAAGRGARVWAFEPEAANYALLNDNIALNGLGPRVVAYCAALSDDFALDRLYLSGPGAGESCHSFGAEIGFDLAPRASAFAQGCIALRLDALVAAGRIPQPEYVKIDVDGIEHRVLRGMEAALRDARMRSLLVELNTHLAEHLEIRAWLETLGWRWDPAQVMRAVRTEGPFEGVAEHVFVR